MVICISEKVKQVFVLILPDLANFVNLPSEEFLSVRRSDDECDDGPVDAALADEGVLGAEGEVRAHHLVSDEIAVSRAETCKSAERFTAG